MKKTKEPRVPGFKVSGIHCGIKPSAPDLALIVSDEPAVAAGVFTRSTLVGAPVELSRQRVSAGRARAVVVNSGVSNVAMGERGRKDAVQMTKRVAQSIRCAEKDVLVASTGVIGEPLPMASIRSGIPMAVDSLSESGWLAAAEAIRTTDTFAKVASRKIRLGDQEVAIVGIAKGSGMIEPDMATMLSFLATDAHVSPAYLRGVLRRVADRTFNRVSVDGEGSTSDSVIALAGGAAQNPRITNRRRPEAEAFEEAFCDVAEELAQSLARDGEGATKLVTVVVSGARSAAQADQAARRIANSMLVKTALFGGDPNWGRILQTVGAGRIAMRPESVRVRLGGVTVFRRGASAGPAARKKAASRLSEDSVAIEVDLGAGTHSARMWTCDLSYDYVRINAEYTT
jgi:glutamate N-acetyltransferase/amino-acid N-acetyltransferase